MVFQWKKRNPRCHKGQNGKVLVIGGSPEYVGAPALVGMAALRAGADWVTIAAPEQVAWTINARCSDFITHKLDGVVIGKKHVNELLQEARLYDVVVLGNGIRRDSTTVGFVRSFVKKTAVPLVLDADALHMVRMQDCQSTVFTPHVSECAALMQHSNISLFTVHKPMDALESNVVLLKGATDYIVCNNKVAKNHTGNAGMAKAGTGDVLAGLVASFIAQGYNLFDAAHRAAFVNGSVGDMLQKEMGYGYTAEDMVYEIPAVMQGLKAWK